MKQTLIIAFAALGAVGFVSGASASGTVTSKDILAIDVGEVAVLQYVDIDGTQSWDVEIEVAPACTVIEDHVAVIPSDATSRGAESFVAEDSWTHPEISAVETPLGDKGEGLYIKKEALETGKTMVSTTTSGAHVDGEIDLTEMITEPGHYVGKLAAVRQANTDYFLGNAG